MKLRIFRRKIFMGEAEGLAIYYDTKDDTIWQAKKSRFINMKSAAQSLVWVPLLTSLVIVALRFLPQGPIIGSFLIGLTISIVLIIFTNNTFYKNVKEVVPSNDKLCEEAIKTNTIWVSFKGGYQRVNLKIKYTYILLLIVITGIIFGFPIFFPKTIVQSEYDFLLGLSPYIYGLILFINNPIRFFNIVEKLQKSGRIKDF